MKLHSNGGSALFHLKPQYLVLCLILSILSFHTIEATDGQPTEKNEIDTTQTVKEFICGPLPESKSTYQQNKEFMHVSKSCSNNMVNYFIITKFDKTPVFNVIRVKKTSKFLEQLNNIASNQAEQQKSETHGSDNTDPNKNTAKTRKEMWFDLLKSLIEDETVKVFFQKLGTLSIFIDQNNDGTYIDQQITKSFPMDDLEWGVQSSVHDKSGIYMVSFIGTDKSTTNLKKDGSVVFKITIPNVDGPQFCQKTPPNLPCDFQTVLIDSEFQKINVTASGENENDARRSRIIISYDIGFNNGEMLETTEIKNTGDSNSPATFKMMISQLRPNPLHQSSKGSGINIMYRPVAWTHISRTFFSKIRLNTLKDEKQQCSSIMSNTDVEDTYLDCKKLSYVPGEISDNYYSFTEISTISHSINIDKIPHDTNDSKNLIYWFLFTVFVSICINIASCIYVRKGSSV